MENLKTMDGSSSILRKRKGPNRHFKINHDSIDNIFIQNYVQNSRKDTCSKTDDCKALDVWEIHSHQVIILSSSR